MNFIFFEMTANIRWHHSDQNKNLSIHSGQPKSTFRPPPPPLQNLPGYNAWFPTLPTPLPTPPQTQKSQGNESAAAVQPLFRGGNPNLNTWGHPNQIQMISEVCQQVLRSLMNQSM